MYIISKFKDYYDGVAGSMGIDKTIVYERKNHIIEENSKEMPKLFQRIGWNEHKKSNNPFALFSDFHFHTYLNKNDEYDEIIPFVIGFCGKYYVGWELIKKVNMYDNESIITYDVSNVENLVRKSDWFDNNFIDIYNNIINFDNIEIFREFNTPIFVLIYKTPKYGMRRELHINPVLKDFDFYKVFDAFTAFQELQ